VTSNALKIDDKDNVAVATEPIARGAAVVVNGESICTAAEDIRAGHKVALVAIPAKGKVIRYGEVIVVATRPIARGEWVHIHNTQPTTS
jgi:altronate hydrolase